MNSDNSNNKLEKYAKENNTTVSEIKKEIGTKISTYVNNEYFYIPNIDMACAFFNAYNKTLSDGSDIMTVKDTFSRMYEQGELLTEAKKIKMIFISMSIFNYKGLSNQAFFILKTKSILKNHWDVTKKMIMYTSIWLNNLYFVYKVFKRLFLL